MQVRDIKSTAKDILQEAIGTAYYKVSDNMDLSEDEKELLIYYINKYARSACKAIRVEYITY